MAKKYKVNILNCKTNDVSSIFYTTRFKGNDKLDVISQSQYVPQFKDGINSEEIAGIRFEYLDETGEEILIEDFIDVEILSWSSSNILTSEEQEKFEELIKSKNLLVADSIESKIGPELVENSWFEILIYMTYPELYKGFAILNEDYTPLFFIYGTEVSDDETL